MQIRPSIVNGVLIAPPSKSMTQRAIAAAILAKGKSVIFNPSFCNDSLAALNIAETFGAKVQRFSDRVEISESKDLINNILNCGEAGLAVRMFSPIASLKTEEIRIIGEGSLLARPLNMIEDALVQLGVIVESNDGFLPLKIKGPLKGGKLEIDGSTSSQLLTGLLMALPCVKDDSEIYVKDLKSKPYIDMTIQLLDYFGIEINNKNYEVFKVHGNQLYKPREYIVEGDWSGAAFLLVAGAIGGKILVKGLSVESKQSDIRIIDALRDSDAKIRIDDNEILVEKSNLKCFKFDANSCPDLFPPLVALASYCEGISVIKGVGRLIYKESNRADSLKTEFGKLGIKIEIKEDEMLIKGGIVKGGIVDSHNDHRIAMALAIAALGAEGNVTINRSDCVSKSYPEFFDELEKICKEK